MQHNPPSNGEVPVHRPLPSVDIPLLREERRHRARMVWLGPLIALLAGLSIAGGWFFRQWVLARHDDSDTSAAALSANADTSDEEQTDDESELGEDDGQKASTDESLSAVGETEEKPAQTAKAVFAPLKNDEHLNRSSTSFGKAKGFQDALIKAGVSEEESEPLIDSLKGILDFRRCQPSDQIVLEKDEQGMLRAFEYHVSSTRIFRAERTGKDSFTAKQKEVKTTTVRVGRGGRVKNSLGDALEKAGLGRSLVGSFVQVFNSRFSFTTDTREGDSFRIVVDEIHLRGEFLRYGTVHALEYRSQKRGTLKCYWYEAQKGAPEFFDETGRAIQGGWLRTPLRYEYVSSPFANKRFHPILKRNMPHHGIDYVAASGVPVWAAADGRVSFVGEKGPNGNLVVINHNNGYQSYYAHLLRFTKGIKKGQRMKRYDVLGYVGSTGRSTAPHLHFGLKRGGRFVDPVEVLNTPGNPLKGSAAKQFQRHSQALLRELERIPIH
ncbi:MAG: peptidoglycan DD-metalloendopeptidase family protein [Myxococcales bacterium]|nr:MAG: peptidoglycan DD-metalloendopeptidase family protein [Myxococcales bacterium]